MGLLIYEIDQIYFWIHNFKLFDLLFDFFLLQLFLHPLINILYLYHLDFNGYRPLNRCKLECIR